MTNSFSKLIKQSINNLALPRETFFDKLLLLKGGIGGIPITEIYTRVLKEELCCWWNAIVNKEYYDIHHNKKLRLVFGSLYAEGVIVFGDKKADHKKWMEKLEEGDEVGWDAHCWLEDKEGRIYDMTFVRWAKGNTDFIKSKKKTRMTKDELVEGWTYKEMLERKGLQYVPMDKASQLEWISRLLIDQYASFTTKWYVTDDVVEEAKEEAKRLSTY